MKTLRISLLFIIGVIFSINSYAQEPKTKKKAKIKIEVIDDNGNKKVVDTTFTIDYDCDYIEILRQIKEQAGFSDEEIAKMKSELKEYAKQMTIDMDVIMDEYFDNENVQKHMMTVSEEMQEGKENLQKALEELKIELESMKMNEKAMEKLEKAMEEFHQVEWAEQTEQLKAQMKDLHKYFNDDENIFVMNAKQAKKSIWIDNDGEKRITINMNVDSDGDSLELREIIIKGDSIDNNQNIWVEKDGERLLIKKIKGGENMVFFGDDADLEEIYEIDGGQLIVKKLKGEAAKGDAIFISNDVHMIKEDGNVRVIRLKSDEGEDTKVIVDVSTDVDRSSHGKMLMISTLDDGEIAKATAKGILDSKAEALELNNFTLNIDDEITTITTAFKEKGKLKITLFDADMNEIWEQKAGKVSGEWSGELPSELLKKSERYFLLFNKGKEAKLLMITIK